MRCPVVLVVLVMVGSRLGTTAAPFDGSACVDVATGGLDELEPYDRALSAAELASLAAP